MNLLPYLFFVGAFIIGGIILGLNRYRKAKAKIINQTSSELKKNGFQISIDLSACEIKHRQYYEGNELRDISVIVYNGVVGGKNVRFVTPSIYLSREQVQGLLKEHQRTLIYVDMLNPNRYYFDIEFLLAFFIL
jgi:hypothetical protein